jgi:predicted ABC-type transport system involved in lysophospholipase L1 biosynthesis ATPase subunit
MSPDSPLVRVRGLVKRYQALRPLRLESLMLAPGARVALTGLDAAAAEMLVALLTGATTPDSGEIELFGRSTRDIPDSGAWLALLDRVGIVTDRAVLVPQFSVEQNMAMPFTLEVDPVAPAVRPAIEALAAEVGIAPATLATPVGHADAAVVARVRLARALAPGPAVLIAEHPSAALPREAVRSYAIDLGRVARVRKLALLAITADKAFVRALGGEHLTVDPATGHLRTIRLAQWRRLLPDW